MHAAEGSPVPGMTRGPAKTVARGEFFARRISVAPLIFLTSCSRELPIGSIAMLSPHLRGRRVHALLRVSWSLESRSFLRTAADGYHRHAQDFPEHRVTFLCNTPEEVRLLETERIPGKLCNHNLFVDSNVFDIDPHVHKDFDAIYVAVMRRYKRHLLCRDIPRVALVYYDAETRGDRDYFAETRAGLPNAIFVNEQMAERTVQPVHSRAGALINRVIAGRRHVNLLPHQVAAWINRAHVGLCLSEEEGAMVASAEYLLCGVPVVTTPSRGGRDRFLRPEFSRTVDADPATVAQAVAELRECALSPEAIRGATLAMMAEERARLREILAEIFEAEGIGSRLNEAWQAMPFGSLQPRWTVEAFLEGV